MELGRTLRRCTECGAEQHLEQRAIDYPESGLDNVRLFNVPIWVCLNGHEEVQIPAITQLHELLAQMIIRKPALLNGQEIRFLRKRLELPANRFAQMIGISPVHLSRLETGDRKITHKRTDLLIRLAVALLIAARDQKLLSAELAPLIDKLEAAWDIGSHRIRHVEAASPEDEWEEEASA